MPDDYGLWRPTSHGRTMETTPLSKFDRSISMLTWGFNEKSLIDEFMEKAIRLLESVCDDFEIIYINDCSTDGSAVVLKKWEDREPRLRVITNERNLNVGWNTRIAVSAATKDFLFWQMVDWCYDISNLRFCLELLKYTDVVQGIRVGPPRRIYRIPLLGTIVWGLRRSDNLRKGFISLVNYAMLRILFRVPFHDFQNVTIYPRELAQSLDLVSTTSFANPEMLLKAFWRKASFIEVPIDFVTREKGKAKGSRLGFVLRSVKEIVWYWWRWIVRGEMTERKPGRICRLSRFLQDHPELEGSFLDRRTLSRNPDKEN